MGDWFKIRTLSSLPLCCWSFWWNSTQNINWMAQLRFEPWLSDSENIVLVPLPTVITPNLGIMTERKQKTTLLKNFTSIFWDVGKKVQKLNCYSGWSPGDNQRCFKKKLIFFRADHFRFTEDEKYQRWWPLFQRWSALIFSESVPLSDHNFSADQWWSAVFRRESNIISAVHYSLC